jgi:hypothetical protein
MHIQIDNKSYGLGLILTDEHAFAGLFLLLRPFKLSIFQTHYLRQIDVGGEKTIFNVKQKLFLLKQEIPFAFQLNDLSF